MAKEQNKRFKTSLNKLEKAVKRLEEGDIDLEKSVDIFVDGMESAAYCQTVLNEAEKRIEIVLKGVSHSKDELRDFDDDEYSDEE